MRKLECKECHLTTKFTNIQRLIKDFDVSILASVFLPQFTDSLALARATQKKLEALLL